MEAKNLCDFIIESGMSRDEAVSQALSLVTALAMTEMDETGDSHAAWKLGDGTAVGPVTVIVAKGGAPEGLKFKPRLVTKGF